MRAVWCERFGPADEVLKFGEMADPVPGPGEVPVRVCASAVNPTDEKLRAGLRPGARMPFPRIVPHSDGAGVIEALGAGSRRSVSVSASGCGTPGGTEPAPQRRS